MPIWASFCPEYDLFSYVRYLGNLAIIGLIVFLGIQVIHPALKNPPVTAAIQVPPEVHQILKSSCYNCHSNETSLPLFDRVAPQRV